MVTGQCNGFADPGDPDKDQILGFFHVHKRWYQLKDMEEFDKHPMAWSW